MSNRAHLVATKFEDIKSKEISWGFRAFDDYETFVCTNLEESEANTDDELEFLDIAIRAYIEENPEGSLFTDVKDSQKGMYVNGTWMVWEEIEGIVTSALSSDEED